MSRRCCLARRLAHCAARPLPAAAVPACSTLPAHRQAYLAELVAHEDVSGAEELSTFTGRSFKLSAPPPPRTNAVLARVRSASRHNA